MSENCPNSKTMYKHLKKYINMNYKHAQTVHYMKFTLGSKRKRKKRKKAQ